MAATTQRSRSNRYSAWGSRKAWALYVLTGFWLSFGCNPATLSMLLMPWVDDKEPPRCKLSAPNKDTTIAIVTSFGNHELELYPELTPTDNELSEKLAAILRERFAANK